MTAFVPQLQSRVIVSRYHLENSKFLPSDSVPKNISEPNIEESFIHEPVRTNLTHSGAGKEAPVGAEEKGTVTKAS